MIRGVIEDGSCIVEIIQQHEDDNAARSPPLLTAHCNTQLVLCAAIKNWPMQASVGGPPLNEFSLQIPLDDYSCRSRGKFEEGEDYRRVFILKFFTDHSLTTFFNTYSSTFTIKGACIETLCNQICNGKSDKRRKDEGSLGSSDDDESSKEDENGGGKATGLRAKKRKYNEEEEDDGELVSFGELQDIYSINRVICLPPSRSSSRRGAGFKLTISDQL